MNQQQIIRQTEEYVKKTLSGECTGHDWFHVERVRKIALCIGKQENADLFVIELAALLHDIADHKFHGGDTSIGAKKAQEFLESQGVSKEIIQNIYYIVENISFKGGISKLMITPEGKIVQDADRLDALGAIGIGRTFAYGGHKGRELYNPAFTSHTSLAHFDEKLLKLKNIMNTGTGKKLAEERHNYVLKFKQRFLKEWEGEI